MPYAVLTLQLFPNFAPKISVSTMKKLKRWCMRLVLLFFVSSIGAVILYRFIPVYVTPLMVTRCIGHLFDGESPRLYHRWVPLEDISRHLPMAVIASEDNRFAEHHGFDFDAIQQAIDERREGKRRRGASTISQQTAKNVFLWEHSSWVRKGFEAYFTVLIELFWSKERIMEVYLNSIEMGDGIYGAEAVAKHHFNTTPDRLSRSQCALIAASLPNPLRFDSGHPSSYLYRRQRKIMRLMKLVPVFPEPEKKHN